MVERGGFSGVGGGVTREQAQTDPLVIGILERVRDGIRHSSFDYYVRYEVKCPGCPACAINPCPWLDVLDCPTCTMVIAKEVLKERKVSDSPIVSEANPQDP